MKLKSETTAMSIQDDSRAAWLEKLHTEERDLTHQKACLRDKLRDFMGRGCYVEAGQVQLQLRELDRELQKVADRVNDIHKGMPVYWEG